MDKKKKAPHQGGAKQKSSGQHSAKLPSLQEVARQAKGHINPTEFYRDALPGMPEPKGAAEWQDGGLCPFHEDSKTGNFRINQKSGAFKCYACGAKGGDVIAFEQQRTGLDFKDTVRKMARDLGLSHLVGDSGEHGDKRAETRATQGRAAPSNVPQSVGTSGGQVGTTDEPRPILPIPAQAGSPPAAHPRHGRPSAIWCYKSLAAEVLFYVYRFDPPKGRKQILPLTWWPEGWQWKGVPAPRPLFHLDAFTTRQISPVLVCEGEKAADAAAALAPDYVTTTAPNGAQAPEKADWSPLAGRAVAIWPDADEPGAVYAAKVAQEATKAGAASVRVLDLTSFARHPTTGEPRELPKGWDAADALAEAWTPEQVAEALARAPEFLPAPTTPPDPEPESETLKPYFEPTDRGVYYHGVGEDRQTKQLVRLPRQWICSALYVEALTRDERGENWGRLLMFRDRDGRAHVWAMPMHLLKGSGEELRGELLRLGVEVSPHQGARQRLVEYLLLWPVENRARCVSRPGWYERVFVLHDRTIGETDERVIFQSDNPPQISCDTRGELSEWKQHVARLCAGNSRLLFSVSLAFAAILLELAGDESGGFHIRGPSSIGKTTVLRLPASVFGPPGFMQRWRATDNGLESVAEMFNHLLLILDEMAQIDPKAAGIAAYLIANEMGKLRADRGGMARTAKRWRLLFLSAGEIGLAEHMAQAGERTRAGQEVRLVDIPADAGAGLGIFETIHEFQTGAALSRALSEAAAKYYGAPAIAFIEAIQRRFDELPDAIRNVRAGFVRECLSTETDPSGQVQRVAARFGLVAVAGELATAYGITGWHPGEAGRGALACFKAWLAARGGSGDQEETSLLRQVRHFFETHGEARFSAMKRADDDHAPRTSNRAGFVERNTHSDEITWYVLPEVFRAEMCEGFDYRWAEKVLVKHRMMKAGNDGEKRGELRKEPLPGYKGRARCYVFPTGEWED